jgi:hypothetical protein
MRLYFNLYPSLEATQREQAANDLKLDLKDVRRLAMQCCSPINGFGFKIVFKKANFHEIDTQNAFRWH